MQVQGIGREDYRPGRERGCEVTYLTGNLPARARGGPCIERCLALAVFCSTVLRGR